MAWEDAGHFTKSCILPLTSPKSFPKAKLTLSHYAWTNATFLSVFSISIGLTSLSQRLYRHFYKHCRFTVERVCRPPPCRRPLLVQICHNNPVVKANITRNGPANRSGIGVKMLR